MTGDMEVHVLTLDGEIVQAPDAPLAFIDKGEADRALDEITGDDAAWEEDFGYWGTAMYSIQELRGLFPAWAGPEACRCAGPRRRGSGPRP